MSINPPPPPTQPPYGDPQQPYVDPVTAAEADKRRLRNTLIAVIVVGIALIIGAYFFGQSQEKAKYETGEPAYNAIYKEGVESGDAAGTASGEAAGKQEGKAEGTEQGKQTGLKEGEEQGINEGQKQGADAALGGLSDWSTGTPYVVELETGPNANIPFAINSRTLMVPGTLYKVCNSGKGLCTQAASTASGGGPTQ